MYLSHVHCAYIKNRIASFEMTNTFPVTKLTQLCYGVLRCVPQKHLQSGTTSVPQVCSVHTQIDARNTPRYILNAAQTHRGVSLRVRGRGGGLAQSTWSVLPPGDEGLTARAHAAEHLVIQPGGHRLAAIRLLAARAAVGACSVVR